MQRLSRQDNVWLDLGEICWAWKIDKIFSNPPSAIPATKFGKIRWRYFTESAAPLCHTLSIEVSIPNEYSMTYMACWRLLLLVELLQLNEYVGFIKKTKIHTNCEQQTDFRTYQCSSPLHTDVVIVNT